MSGSEDDNVLVLTVEKVDVDTIWFVSSRRDPIQMTRSSLISDLCRRVKYKRAYIDSIPLEEYSTLDKFHPKDTIAFTSHKFQDYQVMEWRMGCASTKDRIRFKGAFEYKMRLIREGGINEKTKPFWKRMKRYLQMIELAELHQKIEELEERIAELEASSIE